MRIKISADSTCDLSQDLIEKYDISIVPLYVVKGEKTYRDGVDIQPSDIFEYVENGQGTCNTSAVNIVEYTEWFENYLKEYDAVIHINISGDLSTCNQSACIAASQWENVYIVDSRNLSTGSGHLVLDAALLAAEGMAPADIKAELDRRASKIEASFVINTLKYLHKGGRCSGVAALGANLLKIKPCIEVVNGKMEVGKKYRGPYEKVILQYVEDRLKNRDDIDYRRIFITHTPISEEIIESVTAVIQELGQFEEIIETTAGCTISNHCGPATLGILFYKK